MSPSSMSRRAILASAAVWLAVAAGGAASAQGADLPISAIRVGGDRTATLQALAAYLAEVLPGKLGGRYVPRAKGGATLIVTLRLVMLGESGNNGRYHDHASGPALDTLDGHVTLLGPRGQVLADFPLLVTAGNPFGSSVMHMDIDARRLRSLAETYAYWTASRLS